MPIYIDEEHFEENKNTILNTFSLIKSGIPNNNEYKFESSDFFEIFVIIINKLLEGILNDNSQKSNSFIECFFIMFYYLKNYLRNLMMNCANI